MEKELLQRAIDSILHGSTQSIPVTDSYGNTTYNTVRINDLRIQLVSELARQLIATPEYKEMLKNVFTAEVITKIKEQAISLVRFDDLDYSVREKIKGEIKAQGYEVKRYKIVAEVVED